MVARQDFINRLKSWNHFVRHSKQYHRKYCSVAFIWMDFFHRFRSNIRDVCKQPIKNSTSNSSQSAFIWRVHFRIQSTNSKVKNTLHLTNRFHLVVRVYSDNPPMTSKRDANKILMMFLLRFDVFCSQRNPLSALIFYLFIVCLFVERSTCLFIS